MCDGAGGARARYEEVRSRCRASAECQGGHGAGEAWSRVIGGVELITIVMRIDFCLPVMGD
jgi:hypothetical protein